MASKVDMSLDDLIKLRKKGRGGLQKQQRGARAGQQNTQRGTQKTTFQKIATQKGFQKPQRGGFQKSTRGGRTQGQQQRQQNSGAAASATVSDLRDMLTKKQKTTVTDLRAKLTPKSPQKGAAGISTRLTPRNTGPKPKGRPRAKSPSPLEYITASRRNDAGPSRPATRRQHDPPVKLPSFEETKKITITVPGLPGLNRPTSESYPSTFHREERLAAAIARSREARQESFMRGREEFLASAITSALTSHAVLPVERERGSMGVYPRVHLRGFSRSPSPVADLGYDPQFLPSRAPILPKPKGLTTTTSMVISNLSDTVSKNDVGELCSAVGLLEAIHMPAPGVAEVVFKYKDDALEAFKKYNQRNLDGQPMICKLQPASRSRMAAGGYGGRSLADDDYYHSLY